MAIDVLGPEGARVSAAMILTKVWNISVSVQESLTLPLQGVSDKRPANMPDALRTISTLLSLIRVTTV